MWVTVEGGVAVAYQLQPGDLDWLKQRLAVPTRGAKGAVRMRSAMWRGARFPAGHLPALAAAAARDGVTFVVDDRRALPAGVTVGVGCDTRWLAPYQLAALIEALTAAQGIVKAPTGAGKTEIIAAAVAAVPCRWVIFTHRKSLLGEIADRIELRTGERAGVVGEGAWRAGRVTVAMLQTVTRALAAGEARASELLQRAGGLITDEVHVLGAPAYFRTALACPAYFRIGFSATPFGRDDDANANVLGAIGPVVYQIEQATLAASGAIARGTIHVVRRPVARGRYFARYDEAYGELLARDPDRIDAQVAVLSGAMRRPALAFVRAEDHGKLLARALNAAGVTAEFVWGKRGTPQRAAAVRRLEDAETDVIVASVVFQEGVNIPALRSVANFGGGKSEVMTLQNAGRGSRSRDRSGALVKAAFEVWDLADQHCGCRREGATPGTFVYRHNVCRWFDMHTEKRLAHYHAEGYTVVEHRIDEFL